MTVERADGQPKTRLFPLNIRSTDESVKVLRYIYKNNTGQEVIEHLNRVFVDLDASSVLMDFLVNEDASHPPHSQLKTRYVFGIIVAADSILTEGIALETHVPLVLLQDIRQYKKMRLKKVGENWMTESPEVQQHTANWLRAFLCKADPELKRLTEGFVKLYGAAPSDYRYHQRDLAYLLGIADVYFPLRIAEDRLIMKTAIEAETSSDE